MRVVAYTERGPARDHDEDALFVMGCAILGCSMGAPATLDAEASAGLLAVIDGMGGHEGGERAARLVALSLLEDDGSWDVSMEAGKRRIAHALERAVRHIARAAAEDPALADMGAAVAGVALCSDGALAFNCGDCRVYGERWGYLERLTRDHSIVQELLERGEIDEDGMRAHPRKNILTACVSADASFLDVRFRTMPWDEARRIFICSDGVWEALSLEEMEACLRDAPSREAGEALARALHAPGGKRRDDASFIIASA